MTTDPAPQPEKAKVVRELAHKAPLIACRFDPTGRTVVASSEDRTIQRWSLETGQATSLAGHDSWAFALAFSPDGQTLLTGGGDGAILWWSAASEAPETLRKVEAHHGWVRTLAVSPDGKLLASAGNDRVVRLWSLADGSPVMELPGHERPVYKVAFDPRGQALYSADLKGVVIEWDTRPGKEARRYDAAKLYKYEAGQGVDYGGVRDLDFAPDGSYIALAGLVEASNPLGAVSNPAVLVLDRAEGKERVLARPKEDVKGVAWGLRCHPAGFIVMVSGGTGGGFLWFFKPDQPNEFAKLNLGNTGRALDLHPDGLRVATAHHDGKLRITSLTG